MTAYTHKPWRVAAIQWTGDNFPAVEQFVRDNIGPDVDTGVRNEPDGYNMVQFYAWGDDQEVDPGRWIVAHVKAGGDVGEIMRDDDFRAAYEPAINVEVTA